MNLDYAASTPVMADVWEAVEAFVPWYSSVHRGTGLKSQVATDAYESARGDVAAFVGARPNDLHVREVRRHTFEEGRLAPVRVEKRHLTIRQLRGQHEPRRAVSRADVHDWPIEGANDLHPAARVLDEHGPRLAPVRDRRQAGRGEDEIEPALEPGIRQSIGVITT